MKIIKLSLALAFFCMLNSMCQAMTDEQPMPISPHGRNLSPSSSSENLKKQNNLSDSDVHSDAKPTNGTSSPLQHYDYDVDGIIRTIQGSSKNNYFENHLLIGRKLFKKIHDKDQKIIMEFKKVLSGLTKNPIDTSAGGGYNIDYHPESNKVIGYISNPL